MINSARILVPSVFTSGVLHTVNSHMPWCNWSKLCRVELATPYQLIVENVNRLNEARDDRVAVASAGPYADHLHRAADRRPRQHLVTRIFTGQMLFLTLSQQCQCTEGNLTGFAQTWNCQEIL